MQQCRYFHIPAAVEKPLPRPSADSCSTASTYLDHDTAAAHHLAGFALPVDLAQTDPLTKLFVVINLKQSKIGIFILDLERNTNLLIMT